MGTKPGTSEEQKEGQLDWSMVRDMQVRQEKQLGLTHVKLLSYMEATKHHVTSEHLNQNWSELRWSSFL